MQAKRSRVAVAVGLVVLAIPASAGGATQIGETFSPPLATNCSNLTPTTYLQSGSPGGQYAAPFAGILTSWSFEASAFPPQLKLKVARPAGGESFTIVGEGELKTPTPTALNTYPVRIAVQPGDVIGLYAATSGRCARSRPGYTYHFFEGDPAPGSTPLFVDPVSVQLDISAILEPDCDSDGFGDETQDPSVLGGTCLLRGRTVTLDANKNEVKKGKRVTLSGRVTELARRGECQSAQSVQLQRKRPKQTAFTTVTELQTDAGGNFSTRRRVKKAFEYRAQAPETATCGGQVSNIEKVKIKRRR
jgi:hypothetical protein